ncbi:TIGR03088 family PEP-CTERM/XrtA system glycosyltransferase [Chromatiaceae bacterium AAb-1]|nr:TIGR03088 family PEP-CTERM/XrtA system glycosyltransferase [Chromatiaceae bacterium AAb-1]
MNTEPVLSPATQNNLLSTALRAKQQLHIVHLVWSFRTGGLENGVVNLINQLDYSRFRHTIICLTDYDPQFYARILHPATNIYTLRRKPGHDFGSLWQCYRLLRELKPDICHSRNLAALEYQLPAWLAGVPCRIHGEHGWDIGDLAGSNRKYIRLKRLFRPLISQYISLSHEGAAYLQQQVKVPAAKLNIICNGVDTAKFTTTDNARQVLPAPLQQASVIFGSIGRMAEVKNHSLLVDAFIRLCQQQPLYKEQAALVIIGDGPCHIPLQQKLAAAGLADRCWLPGNRSDIASLLPAFSVFVLPSLAEGISNTILEAMACGIPVIASKVGGNPELVTEGITGWLFPSQDKAALIARLQQCLQQPDLLKRLGHQARLRAEHQFSLQQMASRYAGLYLQSVQQQEN